MAAEKQKEASLQKWNLISSKTTCQRIDRIRKKTEKKAIWRTTRRYCKWEISAVCDARPGRASQTAEIMMIRPRRRQPAPTATLLWVDRSTWLFLFWSQAVLESKQYKFGCSDPKCGKNMRIWVRPQDWTTPTGWFQDKEVQAVERRKRFSVYLRQAGQADREGLWTRTWLSQYLHLRCAGRLYQQLSADQERVIRGPFSQFWQTIIDGCDQIQNAVNILDRLEAVRKVLGSAISGLGDMVYLVEEPKKESQSEYLWWMSRNTYSLCCPLLHCSTGLE